MKRLMFIAVVLVAFAACNSDRKSAENAEGASSEQVLNIPDFMELAELNLDKEVVVMGTVSHVCSHSGKRCFIVDSTANQSIRVEATGDIPNFNRELSGRDIIVTGIVREKRLDNTYLDEWEMELKEQQVNEEEGDHCAAELENIDEMRQWMKDKNRDYYSIYYIDGTSYKLADEVQL
ncbi:MAG: hypothetical protein PHX54_12910 [Lentimicrobiaceae bacterium]|nr:hypothetical protein [Lentimicrobiaceae bacterium]